MATRKFGRFVALAAVLLLTSISAFAGDPPKDDPEAHYWIWHWSTAPDPPKSTPAATQPSAVSINPALGAGVSSPSGSMGSQWTTRARDAR